MKKIIYFTEGTVAQPMRFIRAYRKKSLFKREEIQFSYFAHELDIDDETAQRIIELVKKHYPKADVGCDTVENFGETMAKYRYYAVSMYVDNGSFYGFDTGITWKGENEWTTVIEDAQLYYDHKSAGENASMIAMKTGAKVTVSEVYVNEVNPLSEQEFVITCKSRKSGRTQFYARTEGTRIRLVRTSDAAARFLFADSLSMFDELKAKNKAFFYTVMPYIPNVNCNELERMYEEKKIPVAINVTDKIKWMGSERKGKD